MAKYVGYPRMVRKLLRCAEIAAELGMAKEVTRVHSDVLAPVSAPFCKSHETVVLAQTAVRQKGMLSRKVVDTFDPFYRGTRSVVLAFAPGTVLPDTLKTQPTDTDALYAITTLTSLVTAHAGQPWADELMEGQYGTLAPKAEAALNATIAATKALAVARQQRTTAYVAVYEPYMAFKRVVRDVLGSSSVHYRRLHPRTAGSTRVEPAEDTAPDSGVMPASKAPPALANGPSSVKMA